MSIYQAPLKKFLVHCLLSKPFWVCVALILPITQQITSFFHLLPPAYLQADNFFFYMSSMMAVMIAPLFILGCVVLLQQLPLRHKLAFTIAAFSVAIASQAGLGTINAISPNHISFNSGVIWGLFAYAGIIGVFSNSQILSKAWLWGINISFIFFYGIFSFTMQDPFAWGIEIELSTRINQIVMSITLISWTSASVIYFHKWYQGRNGFDWWVGLGFATLTIGFVSLGFFDKWTATWWLFYWQYFIFCVIFVIATLEHYPELRRFKLTPYYALTSLILTSIIGMAFSALYGNAVERGLTKEYSLQALDLTEQIAYHVENDLNENPSIEYLRELGQGFIPSVSSALATSPELVAIFVYDAYGHIVYGNDATLQINPVPQTLLLNAFENKPYASLQKFKNPDKPEQFMMYAGSPLHGLNGESIGVLVGIQNLPRFQKTIFDAQVSGLSIAVAAMAVLFLALLAIVRHAEQIIMVRTQELATAYANLQRSEAMRDDLTQMIVHDLRSPLSSVMTNLDLLDRVLDRPERRKRYLKNARNASNQMLGLIDDMLDVAKMDQDVFQIEKTPTDITLLLEGRTQAFSGRAISQGKQLEFIALSQLPSIAVDADLLCRVLDNLISNAFRYTSRGGYVQISAEHTPQQVLFKIIDDGVGISAENALTIFSKFVQHTPKDSATRRRGAGLGLAFCQLAVQAHGGQIWVESEVGRGSTFLFTLPCMDSIEASLLENDIHCAS